MVFSRATKESRAHDYHGLFIQTTNSYRTPICFVKQQENLLIQQSK